MASYGLTLHMHEHQKQVPDVSLGVMSLEIAAIQLWVFIHPPSKRKNGHLRHIHQRIGICSTNAAYVGDCDGPPCTL